MNDALYSHLPFVDGVVFDFGGVIALSPRKQWKAEAFARALGLSRVAFEAGFARWRTQMDASQITIREMYRRIFADAGLPPPVPADLDELCRLDEEGWATAFSAKTYAFMREVKAFGKKVGVLTNMSRDFAARYYVPRAARFRALLDAETVSGEEGVCKPDPRLYATMAARLGIAPARLLFIDDSPRNVEAARLLGWRAEVYCAYLPPQPPLPPVVARADDAGLDRAAAVLRAGGVVVIPTDTVYGLAAHPACADAVARLYTIKGRAAKKPVALLAADAAAARAVCGEAFAGAAERLAADCWPGALTVVAGGEGVRVPDLAWTRELLRRVGGTLRVTSANLSGQREATDAPRALADVGLSADLVVDGGTSPGGVASTVVRVCADGSLEILRPGPDAVCAKAAQYAKKGK